jgi:hypothetical protein
MAEFVYLFRTSEEGRRAALGTPEQAQRSLQAWLAWIRELETSGHLKNRGLPLSSGGCVVRGSARTVTDGPYVEAKDMVMGFITVEARDADEAAALAGGCPMLHGSGSVEIRPVETGMRQQLVLDEESR